MKTERLMRLELPYVITLALLVVHEIDSAFWHEWDLFGLPGGIQLFLAANLALLLPFLYGLVRLSRSPRAGAPFSVALACAGVAAFGIHTYFLLRGRPEFRLPASLAVLGVTLATSLWLLIVSVRTLRSGPHR